MSEPLDYSREEEKSERPFWQWFLVALFAVGFLILLADYLALR